MKQEIIYLAGGCFWGLEAYFRRIPGVLDAISGYANGEKENPSYEEVCKGSGHAETIQLTFDPEKLNLSQVLQYFLRVVDPFSVNKQGNDEGIQYRSGVYYTTDAQKDIIEEVLARAASYFDNPFAIEVLPLQSFYRAEEYHQQYLDKNPNGYCHIPLHLAHEPLIDESNYEKYNEETLKDTLSPLAYKVTQQSSTETAFSHEYIKEFRPGIYVDVTSGEPLFISTDKFESGCGWPSFSKPISSDVIHYFEDNKYDLHRIEVRSRVGDSHLGHVFNDGPKELGGLRYCINGVALTFIPKEEMEEKGYGEYLPLLP